MFGFRLGASSSSWLIPMTNLVVNDRPATLCFTNCLFLRCKRHTAALEAFFYCWEEVKLKGTLVSVVQVSKRWFRTLCFFNFSLMFVLVLNESSKDKETSSLSLCLLTNISWCAPSSPSYGFCILYIFSPFVSLCNLFISFVSLCIFCLFASLFVFSRVFVFIFFFLSQLRFLVIFLKMVSYSFTLKGLWHQTFFRYMNVFLER